MTFTVHDTDTLGRTHFMAGKNEEIAIQGLYINLFMRCRLSPVKNNYGAYIMSTFSQFGYRKLHTEYVAYMSKGYNLSMAVNFIHFTIFKMTTFIKIHIFQSSARSFGYTLPGYQVGMVFGNGNYDFVAFLYIMHTIAESN